MRIVMQPEDAGRKHPVHWPARERCNRAIIVFLTVCTAHRKAVLANGAAVAALRGAWQQADAWLVGRYVVMPDHLHLFCAPRVAGAPLKRWVQYWKSLASMGWPHPGDQPLWQKDFWDRQLRRGDSYAQKWDYVWRNPVRHDLVKQPEDWPWAGELNSLMWHDP